MNMNKIVILAIISILTCSFSYLHTIQQAPDNTSRHNISNRSFQEFLDHFTLLELPFSIKGCEANDEDFILFDEDNSSPYIPNMHYAVGEVKANGNYVAIITLGTADCLLPQLTTYTFDGKVIDSKSISIGYCGHGPCYDCEESMLLQRIIVSM